MRIIAGRCRSLPLESVPGKGTRPTTDRIKETLFNVLQTEVPGAVVLDLFAGSGALGIEALSRGAVYASFVDQDRKAYEVICRNLAFTKLQEESEVLHARAVDAIDTLSARGRIYDLVFLDPPYDQDLERTALQKLGVSACVHADTLFVVETSLTSSFSWLQEDGFYCIKEKIYKSNRHLFLRCQTGDAS